MVASPCDSTCEVCKEYHQSCPESAGNVAGEGPHLNTSLSDKSHAVGQRGNFTGVAINTYKGRFYMLPEKLASMTACPGRVGRHRALHAEAHLAGKRRSTTAAPSLSSPWRRGRNTSAVDCAARDPLA